ncbi:MAG: uroporphyrinogen-III C-methyltransferase, partial [Alphaproteobacteria bacterium]|nr:uroporphyrinogen-III C-methyltransferase [Alphaproteobacteria bacterium]
MRPVSKPRNEAPHPRRAETLPSALPNAFGIAGLVHDADAATEARPGRVSLVGTGPGAAEHLTLKAVRTLAAADVLLIDALVEEEVLDYANPAALRVQVGKRGGKASCRQEDINDLMVVLARSGKHVVRLKSGDPSVFGRAGEEIERLDAEGIPVE